MTYRGHRWIGSALALLLAGWLGGTLWLRAADGSADSGLRLLWEMELPGIYNTAELHPQGGLLVSGMSYQYDYSLSRIDGSGEIVWERRQPRYYDARSVQFGEDGECIVTVDGIRLLALDGNGETLWESRPDTRNYEAQAPGEDSPLASCFLHCGLLNYGFDDAGELCWCVPTPQNSIGYYMFDSVQLGDRANFILHNGNELLRLDADGGILENRMNGPAITIPFIAKQGGPQLAEPDWNYLGVLNGEALLYSNQNEYRLLSGGQEYRFALSDAVDLSRMYQDKLYGDSSEFLMKLSGGFVAIRRFGDEYKTAWSWDGGDKDFVEAAEFGDGFAVLVRGDDTLSQSLEQLATAVPFLQTLLPPLAAVGTSSNRMSYDSGREQLLLVDAHGSRFCLDLGISQLYQQGNHLFGDGEQLYILTPGNSLRCYVSEEQP